jgi:pimeloyl-ACP methyl ester carboxylesterase
MKAVTSKDGTMIAYDQYGTGPTVILVDGALQYRAFDQGQVQLAELLAPHFTVIHYDRRGRGDSTDTQPYAVEREIEDIEALIDTVGGSAFLYGISSGAALAMEAAVALGSKVKKLALYEAPYNDEEQSKQTWRTYINQLTAALEANRRGDALALFMKLTGAPDEGIEQFRHDPMWQTFEAVAPTMAYDHTAIMGEDAAVPVAQARRVAVPTLVMNGGASYPFMHTTAVTLAKEIPNAQHRVLEVQTHEVAAEVLAPVLTEFFCA